MSIDANYTQIKYETKGETGIITFNRPDKLNALNNLVLKELSELLEGIVKNKNLAPRGLILTGSGEKAFIAGADIAEMAKMTTEEARAFGQIGQGITLTLEFEVRSRCRIDEPAETGRVGVDDDDSGP